MNIYTGTMVPIAEMRNLTPTAHAALTLLHALGHLYGKDFFGKYDNDKKDAFANYMNTKKIADACFKEANISAP